MILIFSNDIIPLVCKLFFILVKSINLHLFLLDIVLEGFAHIFEVSDGVLQIIH